MKTRLLVLGLVVALAGVAAAEVISDGGLLHLPAGEDAAYRQLAQINPELVRAGTAKVSFDASLTPGGVWAGTSAVRFGGTPAWDTSYTKATLGTGTIPLRRLHVGDREDYYTSPELTASDGRAWFDPARTGAAFGRLGTPQNDVSDITTWLRFLDKVDEYHADRARTDELPDVAGAPNEYQFRCDESLPLCPPPLGSDLDQVFNAVPIGPDMKIWLDDDGRLRRLEVSAALDYLQADGGRDPRDTTHPLIPSDVRATFELSDFGTPVVVEAPAASTITGAASVG